MSNDIGAGSSDSDLPKKGGFDISSFTKHVAEVASPIGTLYLFSWRNSDLPVFDTLSSTGAADRIRQFIPYIASFSDEHGWEHKHVGVPADEVSQLSDEAIEDIADVYALSNIFYSAREGGYGRPPVTRATDEPATAYLDRLIRSEIEEDATRAKKINKSILGSTLGVFDQLHKASQELDNTRQQFERLATGRASSAYGSLPNELKSLDHIDRMIEHDARLTRERSEDREMVRLTGQMTAQSAKTLQELAAAASTMLQQLDIRDKDAKRTTKIQLWWAVISIAVSGLLSLGALVISFAAYKQDEGSISSGDKWQASVLDELQLMSQKSSQLEASNRELIETVEQLKVRIFEVESHPNTSRGDNLIITPAPTSRERPCSAGTCSPRSPG